MTVALDLAPIIEAVLDAERGFLIIRTSSDTDN